MFKNYIYIMKETFFKKSLNRIFQELYSKNHKIHGKILEFGTNKNSSKKFINHLNIIDGSEIFYADKISIDDEKFLNDKNFFVEDLEKKLSFKDDSFDNIVIFNVLEHVFEMKNAVSEISRCLNTNGCIIGSTPFLYRIHNAPGDFSRYSEQFIEKILLNNNFSEIKIMNFGSGPFTSSYAMIFDITKKIPLLNNLILTVSMLLDKILSLFVKTDLSKIYPITICFTAIKSRKLI